MPKMAVVGNRAQAPMGYSGFPTDHSHQCGREHWPSLCRSQHVRWGRQERKKTLRNSCIWGGSTDDTEQLRGWVDMTGPVVGSVISWYREGTAQEQRNHTRSPSISPCWGQRWSNWNLFIKVWNVAIGSFTEFHRCFLIVLPPWGPLGVLFEIRREGRGAMGFAIRSFLPPLQSCIFFYRLQRFLLLFRKSRSQHRDLGHWEIVGLFSKCHQTDPEDLWVLLGVSH